MNDTLDLLFDDLVHETENAWLLQFGDEEVWLPKSQCEIFLGDQVVTVPQWLAEEEGLEGYEV